MVMVVDSSNTLEGAFVIGDWFWDKWAIGCGYLDLCNGAFHMGKVCF